MDNLFVWIFEIALMSMAASAAATVPAAARRASGAPLHRGGKSSGQLFFQGHCAAFRTFFRYIALPSRQIIEPLSAFPARIFIDRHNHSLVSLRKNKNTIPFACCQNHAHTYSGRTHGIKPDLPDHGFQSIRFSKGRVYI